MSERSFVVNPSFISRLADRLRSMRLQHIEDRRGHLPLVKEDEDQLDDRQLQELVESCFWATMMHEEAHKHRLSICVFREGDFVDYTFRVPLAMTSAAIAQLSPALEGTKNIIIARIDENGRFVIVGFTSHTFLRPKLSSVRPGQLSVSYLTERIAVITESRAVFTDERLVNWGSQMARVVLEDPPMKHQVLAWRFIRDLARRVSLLGHGGTLVFVKDGPWRDAVRVPIIYSPEEPKIMWTWRFSEPGNAVAWPEIVLAGYHDHDQELEDSLTSEESALCAIAQLTTVDGAVLIDRSLRVITFGARLKPFQVDNAPATVIVSEPIEGSKPVVEAVISLGGTRHQSAAQFVYDHKNCLAIVVSQDGPISLMRWDGDAGSVTVVRHAELVLS
jgi:hypothetical protein